MYYSLCLALASVCPDYLQPHLCPEFSLISVCPDIYVSLPMNNELTFTASTQGVPFKDYHWTINPRAALETGANAPLARPGGMLGLVFSLSVRLRDLEGNKQRNFSFPPLEKTPPVLTGPLWWPQPLLEVELWPSIGQETKWPTAPPQERAVSPTR